MLTFYDAPVSGNTYKVRLLLGQLAIPHEAVRLDIAGGAVRAKEFRKVNPFGRVPFIVEEGFALAESNAILLYLARGSKLLPADVRAAALVQQWMFFEQNQVETAIGLPRLWRKIGVEQDPALFELQAASGSGAEGPRAAPGAARLARRGCVLRRGHRAVRVQPDGAGGGA